LGQGASVYDVRQGKNLEIVARRERRKPFTAEHAETSSTNVSSRNSAHFSRVRDLGRRASRLSLSQLAYTRPSMIPPDRTSGDSWIRSSESSCFGAIL